MTMFAAAAGGLGGAPGPAGAGSTVGGVDGELVDGETSVAVGTVADAVPEPVDPPLGEGRARVQAARPRQHAKTDAQITQRRTTAARPRRPALTWRIE